MSYMKILVPKNEVEKKLLQARNGNLIEFCIVPSQFDSGNFSPAFLHLGAVHNDGTYEDLESIYEYRKLKLVKPL